MSAVAPDGLAVVVSELGGVALSRPQLGRLAAAAAQVAADRGVDVAEVAPLARRHRDVLDVLVESVRVGETSWFRDRAQLDAVVALLADRPPDRRRVWNPGCATGQETWSLCALLRRAGVWPVAVTATDRSRPAVAVAAEAAYELRHQRGLDAATVGADGRRLPDGRWQVAEALRRHVVVAPHDLVVDPPVPADVILCRNVLMYLTPRGVDRALTTLAAALPPDGVLVVGHAEGVLVPPHLERRRAAGTVVFGPPRAAAAVHDEAPHDEAPHDGAPQGGAPHDGAPQGQVADAASRRIREAEAALAAGRPQDALAALRGARWLRATDPVAAALLGTALHRSGRPREASRALDAARALLGAAAPTAARQAVDALATELGGGRGSP
jgi:chemotaxis methyl-accepting protein methylase